MGLEVQSPMMRYLAPWTTRSAWLVPRGSFIDACDHGQMKHLFTERSSYHVCVSSDAWEIMHHLGTWPFVPAPGLTLAKGQCRLPPSWWLGLFLIKRLKGAIIILCSLCFPSFLSSTALFWISLIKTLSRWNTGLLVSLEWLCTWYILPVTENMMSRLAGSFGQTVKWLELSSFQ